jgi:DNA helicase-2/ATP-dependent DNA helicase PcrA
MFDQTIYAWRLADVRRVLGLASRLPGLRRVHLETNHRCAPEVVRRAARLIEHNGERFPKRIRSSPRAAGEVRLLPDSGDEVSRARLLLATWASAAPGERHAVLARTNRELLPYAAVAIELEMPFRVADERLWLADERLEAVLAATDGSAPLLPAVRDAAGTHGMDDGAVASLLSWAAPFERLQDLQRALRERREATTRLVRDDALLTLATAHGTKGLEWDHVACIGHDDGTFPSGRALLEAADPMRALEEERRLAYVAWTRARRTLTIVYDPGAPSRFVLEAFDPDELP